MANGIYRLNDKQTRSLGTGKHADGNGLYLIVSSPGVGRWVFLWMANGKRREMGLGRLGSLSLADARTKAAEAKAIVGLGGDPLAIREAADAAKKAKKEGEQSFGTFADKWFAESVEPGLKSAIQKAGWRLSFTVYCKPMRDKPIAEISVTDILEVLKPIWLSKHTTATRVRGRIEQALDAAAVRGLRGDGANPARWRGHLSLLLPKPLDASPKHHAAMDWREVPAFIAALREREALSARALEFVVLTCSRAGEALGARWVEMDLENKIWTIPRDRMKAGREHRVPLTGAMISILEHVRPLSGGKPEALVFPGRRHGQTLTHGALEQVRERMGRADVTSHGFRSSFRDWASECTNVPGEIAEQCLAHAVGSTVERSYRRSDILEKRRALLEQWAGFIEGRGGADVVDLVAHKARGGV